MTTKQIKAALLHSSWTCIGLFIVAAVLFSCFPSQLWLIGILVGSLVGFLATRLPYDRHWRWEETDETVKKDETDKVDKDK